MTQQRPLGAKEDFAALVMSLPTQEQREKFAACLQHAIDKLMLVDKTQPVLIGAR